MRRELNRSARATPDEWSVYCGARWRLTLNVDPYHGRKYYRFSVPLASKNGRRLSDLSPWHARERPTAGPPQFTAEKPGGRQAGFSAVNCLFAGVYKMIERTCARARECNGVRVEARLTLHLSFPVKRWPGAECCVKQAAGRCGHMGALWNFMKMRHPTFKVIKTGSGRRKIHRVLLIEDWSLESESAYAKSRSWAAQVDDSGMVDAAKLTEAVKVYSAC